MTTVQLPVLKAYLHKNWPTYVDADGSVQTWALMELAWWNFMPEEERDTDMPESWYEVMEEVKKEHGLCQDDR